MSKLIAYVLLGACVGLGIKGIDWLIPSPEKRLVVCMNADTGKGICKTLADIETAHREKRPAFTEETP